MLATLELKNLIDGKGFGDNLKYIAEEIRRQDIPWRMRWLIRGEESVPDYIKKVNIDGLWAFYELSTAKIIISNSKKNIPIDFISKKKSEHKRE